MFAHFAIFAGLAAFIPSIAAQGLEARTDFWTELDCSVADVTVDGAFVDDDRSLKYDWQLTIQTCMINYDSSVVRIICKLLILGTNTHAGQV
jgi:hypothetical protein